MVLKGFTEITYMFSDGYMLMASELADLMYDEDLATLVVFEMAHGTQMYEHRQLSSTFFTGWSYLALLAIFGTWIVLEVCRRKYFFTGL